MRKIVRQLFLRPACKVGRTVINLVIFDIAAVIYGYAKGRLRKQAAKGKEIGIHIRPDRKHDRRW